MGDSFIINNGGEGKEVPVNKRVNPLDAIVAKSEASKTKENADNGVVLGDDLPRAYKAAFDGKEEGVVEEPKNLVYGHCNNCRLELTEDKVIKNAIDYQKNEDGSLSKFASRFSVFCKNCMKFITVIDQDAAKMLQDMIRKGVK